jgi:hypothetical protein
MKELCLLIALCVTIALIGCGHSEEKKIVTKEDTTKTPKTQASPKEEKKEADTSTVDLILVFRTNENIEEKDKGRILEAIKKKWCKDKKYEVVGFKEYYANLKKYLGKIFIVAEARSQYTEYTLHLRAGKLVENKGAVEEIEHKDAPPDQQIRGQQSADGLIKEIQFLK